MISKETIESYQKVFSLVFTHNSTAIEGNTLTLMETKLILEDKVSVGGKSMREIYEVINHEKAFEYVIQCIEKEENLNETIIKNIHAIIMENIIVGGIYRNVDVYISGSEHMPLTPHEMYKQIKMFYSDLNYKTDLNEIELAAFAHAEFVKIHPFVDGN